MAIVRLGATGSALVTLANLLCLALFIAGCSGDSALPTKPDDEERMAIVFGYSTAPGPGASYDLYVTSAEGKGTRRLLALTGSDFWPDWSPDGRSIVFSREWSKPTDSMIWIVQDDGTGLRAVPTGPGTETSPGVSPARWSPDGSKLVFTRVPNSYSSQLTIMRADGSELRSVWSELVNAYDLVSWSPSGRLAFQRRMLNGDASIWTIDVDVTSLERLTTGADDREPRWSPDGSKLAFTSEAIVGPALYAQNIVVINADGSGRRLVTDNPAGVDDDMFDWSPDGKWILYGHTIQIVGGTRCILYKIPASGGTPEALTADLPAGHCAGGSWR